MSVPAQYGPEGFEHGQGGHGQPVPDPYGTGAHEHPAGYPQPGYDVLGEAGIHGVDPSLARLGGWPANELEEVLTAALDDPGATPRVIEVLGRSSLWVPLPQGTADAGLPAMELDGGAYVPAFSSENQMRRNAPGMAYGVLPAVEFARGLPPLVGIAVNPGGAVGIPLPAAAVEELCRAGAAGGARVRMWEPLPDEEPVDFLATAAGEFAVTPVVLSARRALGSVEGEPPSLFVGVELDRWQEEDRIEAHNALGRALAVCPLPWPVNLLLLDVAQDPLGDWMHERVDPFFSRD
jgi:SseB protein C-terminal domain/SseB protein N-terminal domain